MSCHHYPLFLKESELDAQLNEQPAKKPAASGIKLSDLAAACARLIVYQTVSKQREALRKSAEFRATSLTDRRCCAKRRSRCRANPAASPSDLNNKFRR